MRRRDSLFRKETLSLGRIEDIYAGVLVEEHAMLWVAIMEDTLLATHMYNNDVNFGQSDSWIEYSLRYTTTTTTMQYVSAKHTPPSPYLCNSHHDIRAKHPKNVVDEQAAKKDRGNCEIPDWHHSNTLNEEEGRDDGENGIYERQ